MDDSAPASSLTRRALLAGAGAGAVSLAAGEVAALPSKHVKQWHITTDVLIVGSGAAGVSAAIEARRAGAQVLLIESLSQFGGSSSLSGGVVYAGGGTSLQRALGIADSTQAMYDFMVGASGAHPHLDKIQQYCEHSPEHFDWLVEQGVPYSQKLTEAKGLPLGDHSLYYSGNERAWPSRDQATPAPRGHVPGVDGMNGGRRLMQALLKMATDLGVTMRSRLAAQQLITESDGRVAGVVVEMAGERKNLRCRRAVVLSCGGFIHNRPMLKRYAPQLYNCSVPWGGMGDRGAGILMAMAVGASALRMHEGFAICPLYPPENVLAGMVVNGSGQRFIAEDSYHGVLGHAIAYQQQGRAYLIVDANSDYAYPQDNFPLLATANSIADLAVALKLPAGALQDTVGYYNRYAELGTDPVFGKSPEIVRPIQGPPYRAYNLSVDQAFFPAHTFGGVQTGLNGEVISAMGEHIPGLFAAGRTTSGIPTAPYFASGLSLGDCTFFGRRAGASAAAQEVT